VAQQQVTDVPAAEVGKVVQDFIDDSAKRVLAEQQADGNYTVTSS
jgi:hypothetical protein